MPRGREVIGHAPRIRNPRTTDGTVPSRRQPWIIADGTSRRKQQLAEKRAARKPKEPQPVISEEQFDELSNILGETGTDVAKFCGFFKIADLRELPANAYDRALRMLMKKKSKVAA